MLECFLVPVTVLVKYEQFSVASISKAEFWVVHVDLPHERGVHHIGVNLLEVANVNVVTVDGAEKSRLVEHNLLAVRQELRMPREELHGGQLTGQLDAEEEGRHDHEWVVTGEEPKGEADCGVIGELAHGNVASLGRFVQVDAVLVGHDSCKACMVISVTVPASEHRECFPDKRIAQPEQRSP